MPAERFRIDPAVRARWQELQRSDARAASGFYFREILPAVVSYHASRSPSPMPCELLLSLMGLSPETTVITTAILRPRALLIIASANAAHYCNQCMEFLAAHSLLRREFMRASFIDPAEHRALYATLDDELGKATGPCLVDLTGGKKIMSAVAGFAAWGRGLPVCYLESRAYDEQIRRPEPGSEELIILASPTPTWPPAKRQQSTPGDSRMTP